MMDFKSRYRRECLLTGTCPLHCIEANLVNGSLSCKFFRIPVSEWNPILSALNSDLTLRKICVTIDVVDHTINNPTHQQKLKHLHSFVESLCMHLNNNQSLMELELIGLPLSRRDVHHLSKAILNSNSLKHLCLAGCKIGNEGTVDIVEAIKMKPNIVWLDFRSCGLTEGIGQTLQDLVHFQRVARENAVWKASLRQEIPNLDLMGGLRRLTLSDNRLSDATTHLVSALHEDRWIKAIDLQFCYLGNSHLEGLITSIEKNGSLVFLDVDNNLLNTELLAKLTEVLNRNSLNCPSFQFEPIMCNPPELMHRKNAQAQIASVKKKKIDVKENYNKAKPVIKGKIPLANTQNITNEKIVNQKRKVNLPKMDMKNKKPSREQYSNAKEGLTREKELRNNAELQVIKIYKEMESAWTRISKLEKEVKQLNKHRKYSATLQITDRFNESKADATNDPLTQSFQICLMRLQDVLKELKLASATQQHWQSTNSKSEEIQMILDVVYAAIREFGPNMIQLKSENRQPNFHNGLEPYSHSVEYETKIRADTTEKVLEDTIFITRHANGNATKEDYKSALLKPQEIDKNDTPSHKSAAPLTSPHDFNYVCNLKKMMKSSNEMLEMFDKVSVKGTLRKTHSRGVCESADSSPSVNSSKLVESVASLNSQILTHQSTKQEQKEESSDGDDIRMNSLKSLKNNLEEILGHLKKTSDDGPSDGMQQSQSQLTITGNLPNLSMTNRESCYSTDFDSISSTPIRNVSANNNQHVLRTKSRKTRTLYTDTKQRTETQVIDDENISCSSSSLNLSSIVDLLGNFSVEDIGSSTLTPP